MKRPKTQKPEMPKFGAAAKPTAAPWFSRRGRDGGDNFSSKPGAPGPQGPDNKTLIEDARERRRRDGLKQMGDS